MPSLLMEAISTLQGKPMAWSLLWEKATQVRVDLTMSHCSDVIGCRNVSVTMFS